MLRTVTARLAAAVLAAGSAVVALPATTPAAEAAGYQPWGRAVSNDKVLRRGCHDYVFRYRITPPRDDWAAEVFLSTRRRGVASRALLSAADPDRGYSSFRLCRQSITYGTYKIRMKVTYRVSPYETRAGWVRPTYFRMVRR